MRVWYFADKALGSLRQSPGPSLLTSGTICAALLVVGAFVMAVQNLEELAMGWGRTATVSAYLDPAAAPASWQASRAALAKLEHVDKAVLITPAEALERFRARGPEAAALVQGVSADILPATVELQLVGHLADLTRVEQVAKAAGSVAGVTDVDYGREELESLAALVRLLRYAGLALGAFMAAATALIVANTIRLTLYARRDEISILRLVGATSWFIRTPFLMEGAIWGILGGLGAVGGLWLVDKALGPLMQRAVAQLVGDLPVQLFALDVAGALLAAGAILGVCGSALAVGRFLAMETT